MREARDGAGAVQIPMGLPEACPSLHRAATQCRAQDCARSVGLGTLPAHRCSLKWHHKVWHGRQRSTGLQPLPAKGPLLYDVLLDFILKYCRPFVVPHVDHLKSKQKRQDIPLA